MDEHDPLVRFRMKHCARCGYSLRQLTSSKCPECGLDIHHALLFRGRRHTWIIALTWTVFVALYLYLDLRSGEWSIFSLFVDAAVVSTAVLWWMGMPRHGVARDGSGFLINRTGVLRPLPLGTKSIPWHAIDAIEFRTLRDMRSIELGRDARLVEVAVRTKPSLDGPHPGRIDEWILGQTPRSRFTASGAEIDTLREAITVMQFGAANETTTGEP